MIASIFLMSLLLAFAIGISFVRASSTFQQTCANGGVCNVDVDDESSLLSLSANSIWTKTRLDASSVAELDDLPESTDGESLLEADADEEGEWEWGKRKGWVKFPPGHEIGSLPGMCPWGRKNLRMSSGYIPVRNSTKHIFYWFVESSGNPSTDPLILWTNGGPGCSGLLGLMTEMGPVRPTATGGLVVNPNAWTQFANMVFIEQPAGVGFSYPLDRALYTDEIAAQDNWDFIQGFLKLYPQLKSLPFWLASESYGGHYIPTFAREIQEHNAGDVDFKGMVIGNPLIWLPYVNYGMIGMWHAWSMIPEPAWHKYTSLECWWLDDSGKPVWNGMPVEHVRECNKLIDDFEQLANNVDPYALGFPSCVASQSEQMLKRLAPRIMARLQAKFKYIPCSGDYATAYLNKPEVQSALHVQGDVKWGECASINYSQDSVNSNIIPVLQELIKGGGLRIMIMSGNVDSVCPTLGDQRWIWEKEAYGCDFQSSFDPWKFKGQVAGYTVNFTNSKGDGLRYATVMGAGHMIPMTQPERGYHLVHKFITEHW